MEIGKVIDLTKMRKGTKPFGRKIEVCPKCGRKGEHTRHSFKAGTSDTYTHTKTFEGFFFSVKEYCCVKVA
jgi:hypothetical protein